MLLKQPGLAQFTAVTNKWEQQGAKPGNTHTITRPIAIKGGGQGPSIGQMRLAAANPKRVGEFL